LLSRQLEEDDPLERYVLCTHGWCFIIAFYTHHISFHMTIL
jgi:hypothetical protein